MIVWSAHKKTAMGNGALLRDFCAVSSGPHDGQNHQLWISCCPKAISQKTTALQKCVVATGMCQLGVPTTRCASDKGRSSDRTGPTRWIRRPGYSPSDQTKFVILILSQEAFDALFLTFARKTETEQKTKGNFNWSSGQLLVT